MKNNNNNNNNNFFEIFYYINLLYKIILYKMSRSFDFVVKAKKVVIKKQGDHKYKVKLAGLGDFLKYQVWSNTNANNINGDRSVSLVNAKDWVKNNFGSNLDGLTEANIPSPFTTNTILDIKPETIFGNSLPVSFTPTTIMEVGNKKYIFVIEDATYNINKKKYNTVFYISTKQIVKNNVSKHLVKFPINKKLNNVRFDIDSSDNLSVTVNVTTMSSQIPELANYTISNFAPSPYDLSFSYNPNTLSIDTNTFSSTNYLLNYSMMLACFCSGGGCSGGTPCLLASYSQYCPVTATYTPSGSNFTITLNGNVNGVNGSEIFSITGNL